MANQTAYYKGVAAEQSVARLYEKAGYALQATRLKSKHGEIDLVFLRDNAWVFVEVKASKNWARAAQRIGPAQIARLHNTAQDYLGQRDLLDRVDCRFDAALVDQLGNVEIIENAFV